MPEPELQEDDRKIVGLAEEYDKIRKSPAWLDLEEELNRIIADCTTNMFTYGSEMYYKAHGQILMAKYILSRPDDLKNQREVILKLQEEDKDNA